MPLYGQPFQGTDSQQLQRKGPVESNRIPRSAVSTACNWGRVCLVLRMYLQGEWMPGVFVLGCGPRSREWGGRTSHGTRVDGKRENLPQQPSVRGVHGTLLTAENCKSEWFLFTCQLSRPPLHRRAPSLVLPGRVSCGPKASKLVSCNPS